MSILIAFCALALTMLLIDNSPSLARVWRGCARQGDATLACGWFMALFVMFGLIRRMAWPDTGASEAEAMSAAVVYIGLGISIIATIVARRMEGRHP